MMKRRNIFIGWVSIHFLLACSAQTLPSISTSIQNSASPSTPSQNSSVSPASPASLQSCLFLPDSRYQFHIQCQAAVSFYLAFQDADTGEILDLKQKYFRIFLKSDQNKVLEEYVQSSTQSQAGFKTDSSNLSIQDTHWLSYYLDSISSTTLTLEAKIDGYKLIQKTINVSENSENLSKITEFTLKIEKE